jgi:predicted nucleotidyltransferase
MKLLMENLPLSLEFQRDSIEKCLVAMDKAMPLREVYLFGSHARGDARPDSDVDLCIAAEGAERQLAAARGYREAIWGICPRVGFTLVPIAPSRLKEKRTRFDHFFETVLKEEIRLA